jgi:4a-hydroxytetrahydrobiopterin dehydratase
MNNPQVCDLTNKNCVPCQGGTPPMVREEATKLLTELGEKWSLNDDATKLKREFKLRNFKRALTLVNHIGDIAETEGHHPDIKLGWGYVKLKIQTHKIDGLTESDFILAAKAEEAFQKLKAEWNK